jgi:hypothetical protein
MTLWSIDDTKHWRDRAAEMRILATTMKGVRNTGHHVALG